MVGVIRKDIDAPWADAAYSGPLASSLAIPGTPPRFHSALPPNLPSFILQLEIIKCRCPGGKETIDFLSPVTSALVDSQSGHQKLG